MFTHPEYKYVFENIPENVVTKTKTLIETHGIEVSARILGYDTENYDTLIVAGRLLMFDLRRKCPLNILEYIEELKEKLQPKYYQFMKDNAIALQVEIDKRVSSDYNHDFFSANAMIKTYLSKVPFDNSVIEIPQMCYIIVAFQLHFDTSLEMVIQEYIIMSEM